VFGLWSLPHPLIYRAMYRRGVTIRLRGWGRASPPPPTANRRHISRTHTALPPDPGHGHALMQKPENQSESNGRECELGASLGGSRQCRVAGPHPLTIHPTIPPTPSVTKSAALVLLSSNQNGWTFGLQVRFCVTKLKFGTNNCKFAINYCTIS
jgi:hypothetical protein